MDVNTPNFETAAATIVYTFVFLLGTIMPSILLCFLGRRRRLLFRYPCFAKESLQVIGLRQLSQFPTSTTACASTEHHWETGGTRFPFLGQFDSQGGFLASPK